MNLPYFISKRISQDSRGSFSTTIHKIAVGSIGIGLGVMIVSFLILKGFQDTVTEKIYNFSAHFQVTKYSSNNSFEEIPITLRNDVFRYTSEFDFIEHVQEFSHKAGLIKTEDEILGIIFKGISERFDSVRFRSSLIEGRFLNFDDDSYSREVMISKVISDKLRLKVGDDAIVHFFQDPPRVRRLKVVGIYETNLSEYYDNKFIIGDIRMIQRLNNWADSLAGGMEIYVKDIDKLDEARDALEAVVDYDFYVEKVEDKYIQVFEWLHLISRQVNIFLGIILFVVCVNMISIILILIMERTQMIGLLKAFGATNALIRRIFLLNGIRLIVKGLLIGNLLGLGLGWLQDQFMLIPLNPRDYYMSYVPIGWNWEMTLILNLLTLLVVALIILIPTLAISKVNPIKSIRFD